MQEPGIRKRIPVFIHVLGWALFGIILFVLAPLSHDVVRPPEFWTKQALMFTLLLLAFYANYFYLIPKILFTNNLRLFLLINFLAGLAYVVLLMIYDDYTNMAEAMHRAFRPGKPYVPRPRNFYWDVSHLIVFYVTVGIGTSIAIIRKWQGDEKEKLLLEQEKTNSELSYLKAQLNPHFFFNTLNNIYALTGIDVDKAQTALLKLSRMMRYVLYETEKNHTLLNREIEFLRDYIELMKIRLSPKVKLNVEMPDATEDIEIAPMLLLPFIENCFKHGVSSRHESQIDISITPKKNELTLITCNTIFHSTDNTPEGNAKGIGLANTKRRLELLYPGRYRLEIDGENPENQFKVHLVLTLN